MVRCARLLSIRIHGGTLRSLFDVFSRSCRRLILVQALAQRFQFGCGIGAPLFLKVVVLGLFRVSPRVVLRVGAAEGDEQNANNGEVRLFVFTTQRCSGGSQQSISLLLPPPVCKGGSICGARTCGLQSTSSTAFSSGLPEVVMAT